MATNIQNRYDFLILFDVQDGNPNGDPDAGNLPRVDAQDGTGLVTDVCLKRKVRNFVQLTQGSKEGFDIFIKEKAILNNLIESAYEDPKVKAADSEKKSKKEKNDVTVLARAIMCHRFYDIRTFGAVMSTGEKNAGQVRGPVQMTFARSVDPVVTFEHSITRMAVTTEKESNDQNGDNRTMGRKFTIPYGLYVGRGFISPQLAAQTGFSQEDLDLFFKAMINMFEHDRSAARGLMSTRKLIVFKHNEALGSAPAWKLFDSVKVVRKPGVDIPRSFEDYAVTVDKSAFSGQVEVLELV